MSAIIFSGVSRSYHSKTGVIKALNQLSFEVPSGSIFGLAGINGAGKTTAIKSMLGMCTPDSGTVTINGNSPSQILPAKIGFAPEIADVPDYLSIEEVISFSCSLLDYDLDYDRLEQVLSILELEKQAKIRTRELSKGTRQRVSLAAAIAHDPELVVFDEPTSGLDPIGRKMVKKLLKKLKAEGKTIFFSTHILTDLQEICDYIGIIHQGSMIFSGTPAQFFDSKNHDSPEAIFESILHKNNPEQSL
ncbi:MAG: type transport system ATP-binding protein [Clostridiales bacterium]|jgi:ABC-2 type transport system ATP-binding protein|nr:type transport system ATP-binding protein [Clostridiales bacterium]MDN5282336.1 type transport system ATP-binding protein [Candidatus Ozemobacter sp.]